MAKIRLNVLGPTELEVDGVAVPLPPIAARILALLIGADAAAVPISRLHREVWPDSLDLSHRRPQSRTDVQKRISVLRRTLNPGGEADGVSLRTETVISGRETESAYRLVLNKDTLDSAEFESLCQQATRQTPAVAAELLSRAVLLWRGPPLAEAGEADFCQATIRRLRALYRHACDELLNIHVSLGMLHLALSLAERIAAERPDDLAAAEKVEAILAKMRAGREDELLSWDFPEARCRVRAVRGDLFEQHDANLVVGFTDTFDTSTDGNEQISTHSVQGQLLHRLYRGDTKALDRDLRLSLRRMTPSGREDQKDKPKGKRIRYPIGTVVAIPHSGRTIFAIAYTVQGNDLVGRSGPAELRLSLERLWEAVAGRGQLRPVAIALVGSKLARSGLSRAELMITMIKTFLARQTSGTAVSPELRIVLLASEVADTDLPAVSRSMTRL